MRLSIISSEQFLSNLAPEWSALVGNAADANTFLTPEWVLSWWEAYKPQADLVVAIARTGDELVGIAPMMVTSERRFGLTIRYLRFIGDGSLETDHMNFIVVADRASEIRRLLLDSLLSARWDIAVFANVPAHSMIVPDIKDWAGRHRSPTHQSSVPCPISTLPSSFDSLLASLPSRFRTSIRSTRKKLNSSHKVEFGLHDDPSGFPDALATLFANHESRWRAKGQSGVFKDERRRRFYELLTDRLHRKGALRFFYLKLDGRVVAQEYCFAHDGTVYLLQEGFDYALARDNVGNALRSYVFEHLIQHGYKAYDFLSGMTRHKLNWSNSTPDDLTMTVARRSPAALAAFYGPLVIPTVKGVIKRALGRCASGSEGRHTGGYLAACHQTDAQ